MVEESCAVGFEKKGAGSESVQNVPSFLSQDDWSLLSRKGASDLNVGIRILDHELINGKLNDSRKSWQLGAAHDIVTTLCARSGIE